MKGKILVKNGKRFFVVFIVYSLCWLIDKMVIMFVCVVLKKFNKWKVRRFVKIIKRIGFRLI